MTEIDVTRRLRDAVRDSKILRDIPSKLHRNFDSVASQMGRGLDGVRHHRKQNTCRVERVLPRRPPAWVCEGTIKQNQRESQFAEWDYIKLGVRMPEFNGSSLKLDFLDWIDAFQDYFETVNLTDTMKCKLVASKLKGAARTWWNELQHTRFREGKNLITSWSRMSMLLVKKFLHTSSLSYLNNQQSKPVDERNTGTTKPIKCSTKCQTEVCSHDHEYDDLIGSYKPLLEAEIKENIGGGISCEGSVNKCSKENDVVKHLLTDNLLPDKCLTGASGELYTHKLDEGDGPLKEMNEVNHVVADDSKQCGKNASHSLVEPYSSEVDSSIQAIEGQVQRIGEENKHSNSECSKENEGESFLVSFTANQFPISKRSIQENLSVVMLPRVVPRKHNGNPSLPPAIADLENSQKQRYGIRTQQANVKNIREKMLLSYPCLTTGRLAGQEDQCEVKRVSLKNEAMKSICLAFYHYMVSRNPIRKLASFLFDPGGFDLAIVWTTSLMSEVIINFKIDPDLPRLCHSDMVKGNMIGKMVLNNLCGSHYKLVHQMIMGSKFCVSVLFIIEDVIGPSEIEDDLNLSRTRGQYTQARTTCEARMVELAHIVSVWKVPWNVAFEQPRNDISHTPFSDNAPDSLWDIYMKQGDVGSKVLEVNGDTEAKGVVADGILYYLPTIELVGFVGKHSNGCFILPSLFVTLLCGLLRHLVSLDLSMSSNRFRLLKMISELIPTIEGLLKSKDSVLALSGEFVWSYLTRMYKFDKVMAGRQLDVFLFDPGGGTSLPGGGPCLELGKYNGNPYVEEDHVTIVLCSWKSQDYLVSDVQMKGFTPLINILGIAEVRDMFSRDGFDALRYVYDPLNCICYQMVHEEGFHPLNLGLLFHIIIPFDPGGVVWFLINRNYFISNCGLLFNNKVACKFSLCIHANLLGEAYAITVVLVHRLIIRMCLPPISWYNDEFYEFRNSPTQLWKGSSGKSLYSLSKVVEAAQTFHEPAYFICSVHQFISFVFDPGGFCILLSASSCRINSSYVECCFGHQHSPSKLEIECFERNVGNPYESLVPFVYFDDYGRDELLMRIEKSLSWFDVGINLVMLLSGQGKGYDTGKFRLHDKWKEKLVGLSSYDKEVYMISMPWYFLRHMGKDVQHSVNLVRIEQVTMIEVLNARHSRRPVKLFHNLVNGLDPPTAYPSLKTFDVVDSALHHSHGVTQTTEIKLEDEFILLGADRDDVMSMQVYLLEGI